MPSIRAFGGIALDAAFLVGCDTTPSTSPIGLTQGTVQEQLRQQQLSNAAQRPGTTSGAVTAINPGTTGITRADGGGSVAGTVGSTLNTDGTVSRPDSGAPSTQIQPRTGKRPPRKRTTTTSSTSSSSSAN